MRAIATAVMAHNPSRTEAFASAKGSDWLGLLVPIQNEVISRCVSAECSESTPLAVRFDPQTIVTSPGCPSVRISLAIQFAAASIGSAASDVKGLIGKLGRSPPMPSLMT